MLLEMLLDDVAVERVAVHGEQTRLQKRRRVVDLVLFSLGKENVIINHLECEVYQAQRDHVPARRVPRCLH